MSRLTIEIVKEAYELIGYKPCNGGFIQGNKCCPVMAIGITLAIKDGNIDSTKGLHQKYIEDIALDKFVECFGRDYFCGFWRGFDNINVCIAENKDFMDGYEDGVRMRKCLSPERMSYHVPYQID